jgi:solute carrier family 50 protein (sugar transporter)
VLGFALGLVQMILYCIYRNGNKKMAKPIDPLKNVVIESSLGGTGEVFPVEEDAEKKKSMEETVYDCAV